MGSGAILGHEQALPSLCRKSLLLAGTSWVFILALALLIGWAATGPLFGFTQQWQLVVNSFTTIVTFLMVFVIQNTHGYHMLSPAD